MHLLLSNDDGIHAPGLHALYRASQRVGKVSVVAPMTQQSAAGHSITISSPLRAERVEQGDGFTGFGVHGTPADAVKLAVDALLDTPPDLVCSGINLGPNAGVAILYSGTVSAATEGAVLGMKSIAFSLNTFSDPLWDTAEAVVDELLPKMLAATLPPDTVINVNIPNLPLTEIQGFRVAPMGKTRFHDVFDERKDPRGASYYWMAGTHRNDPDDTSGDMYWLDQGYVTITPLGLDLTRHDLLNDLSDWTR